MKIDRIDHLVLTVRDIEVTCTFYTQVLGMRREIFGDGRTALHFGNQKFNLHQAGREYEPKALMPSPGSVDICFITTTRLDAVIAHLRVCGVSLVGEGPVRRTGAMGPIESVYLRDPDGNLIEIANSVSVPS